MIRRQDYLRAFPGFYAFPGGKVDAGDGQAHFSHPLLTPYPARQIGALFREIAEELGFDLERAIAQNEVDAISHFGEAITPPFERTRFNAHYFKIEMNRRPGLTPDEREIAWSGWLDHRELHRRYLSGEALMVTPTVRTAAALAEDVRASSSERFNLEYDREAELPYLELVRGVGMIPVPSNTLPPAKTTNALLLGDAGRRRLLVDPSPESGEVYRKLQQTLAPHRVDAIFITHHHHDHHEMAPDLARDLGVPLACSGRTREYLERWQEPGYLEGVDVETVAEGEVLTHWLGQPVRTHALPGHDDGMLGLAPDNMAWFFVADLAQAGATVVIPERGGDMGHYFESLERVIGCRPKVLIPSHGLPMGGTLLLEKTLQHRREREEQVRRCLEQGMDAEAITRQIYRGIRPRLMPLALQNVKQHMKKLEG